MILPGPCCPRTENKVKEKKLCSLTSASKIPLLVVSLKEAGKAWQDDSADKGTHGQALPLNSILRAAWWKETTDCYKLPSDLHLHSGTHVQMCMYMSTYKINRFFFKAGGLWVCSGSAAAPQINKHKHGKGRKNMLNSVFK